MVGKAGYRQTMISISVSMFLVMAGFGIVFPTLPFFAREMGATSVHMGLLITLFALAQFFCAPLWGNLSDRWGRKPILLFGLASYGLAFFWMAFATSVNMLIAARAVAGALSAASFPTAYAIVADISDKEDRAQAMATISASMNLGFIFGPMIGGLLSPLGVQTVFIIAGVIVVVTTIATAMALVEPAAGHERSQMGLMEIIKSVPMVTRSDLGLYMGLNLVVSLSGSAVFSMLSYFLMDRIAADAVHAGWAYTSMGVGSAIVQYFCVGPAIKAFGEKGALSLALIVGIAGYAIIALGPTFTVIIAGIVLNGAAFGLLRPTITSAVSVRTTFGQGFTMGVFSSFDSFGRMLGPLWAGLIYGFSITGPFVSSALLLAVAILFVRTKRCSEEAAS